MAGSARAQVSETGRLSIPVDLRRAMGIEKGGVVSLEMVDGRLEIQSLRQAIERVQKIARDTGLTDMATVDDFLDWKREESRQEDKKRQPR